MLTKRISPFISLYVPVVGLAICLCAPCSIAAKPGKGVASTAPNAQKSFASPEAAAQALLAAAQAADEAALLLLFGAGGKEVLSSGDPVQDKNYRAAFVEKAKAKMKLEKDPMNPNRLLIAIGEDDFPFAIPLKQAADGQWFFDMEEGRFEVLARRIGANELDAIAVCTGYVEAQFEYAGEDHTHNNVREYAQKFISSPGKQDGLYWPQSPGAPPSPISDRITKAAAEGYTKVGDQPTPYHGYYFKILKAQGANAPGGARDYLQRGLMIGGFGLIAWPAEYGVSGIKTFMVNQDGVIFERDLGSGTATAAQAIAKFNPDKTWSALR